MHDTLEDQLEAALAAADEFERARMKRAKERRALQSALDSADEADRARMKRGKLPARGTAG
jgi:hypothetical protein